jgi:NTP pyrophosphatase (non-canonical NTP hydrolase)
MMGDGGHMPHLDDRPTLSDYQRYVAQLEDERGFAGQSARDKCLLLGEEAGELFKAVRRAEGMLIDRTSSFAEIADELADLLIYLCAIGNRYGIDLEAAFRNKETVNEKRAWTKQPPLSPLCELSSEYRDVPE